MDYRQRRLSRKNIAVLRSIEPGSLGNQPRKAETRYSPLYDLVNTDLAIPGDLFALPVNGKQNNLRANDFAALARVWAWTRAESRERVGSLASKIRTASVFQGRTWVVLLGAGSFRT